MRCYQQLSYEERVQLATMQRASFSLSQMARHLERSKSTISRELRRNEAPPGQYWPDTAQQRTLERRKRGCVIDRHEALKDFIMLVVTRLDRLARSITDLIGLIQRLDRKAVGLRVLNLGMDTHTPRES